MVACGGGGDSKTTSEDGSFGPQGAPGATPAPAPTAAPAARLAGGTRNFLVEIEETGRKVISTASVTLVVDDVEAGIDHIEAIANSLNGFVEQLSSSGSAENRRGHVTLRVPPDQFATAMDQIGVLGDVISREVGQ